MTSPTPVRDDSVAHGFFMSGILRRGDRNLLLLLAAAAWWLSLQGAFALGWVALVPLFVALEGLGPRARFFAGWRCGCIAYAAINWWIVPTVVKGSPMIGAPPALGFFLGLLAVALIGAIHGSLVGLVSLLWSREAKWFRAVPALLPVAVALLWALLDAARLETPLAHGWGALAYSQARDAVLLPHARWLGQHGITALCVWSAASLALWMLRSRRTPNAMWFAPVAVIAVLHLTGPLLASAAVPEGGKQLRVLLVQTNVPSLSKNFASGGESGLAQALRLTRTALTRTALTRTALTRTALASQDGAIDLVVWPETIFDAGRFRTEKSLLVGEEGLSLDAEVVSRLAAETGVPILGGATLRTGRNELYNGAVLFSPRGGATATAKSRLVPFGERAPLSEIVPLLSRLAPHPPMTAPREVQPLAISVRGETVRLGAIVCFESCFRYPARALQQRGARLLFVLTNDEWFAGTTALREHEAMLALRAAENGVSTAQSANGGLSSAVDPGGRFVLNGTSNTARADSVLLPY